MLVRKLRDVADVSAMRRRDAANLEDKTIVQRPASYSTRCKPFGHSKIRGCTRELIEAVKLTLLDVV